MTPDTKILYISQQKVVGCVNEINVKLVKAPSEYAIVNNASNVTYIMWMNCTNYVLYKMTLI